MLKSLLVDGLSSGFWWATGGSLGIGESGGDESLSWICFNAARSLLESMYGHFVAGFCRWLEPPVNHNDMFGLSFVPLVINRL